MRGYRVRTRLLPYSSCLSGRDWRVLSWSLHTKHKIVATHHVQINMCYLDHMSQWIPCVGQEVTPVVLPSYSMSTEPCLVSVF